MRLAPVDPAQHYVRCATHGSELTWKVTLSPHGRYLAAVTSAGTVRLIDVASWGEIAQLASPVGELDAVAFSPDGHHLATVSAEAGEVTLWRTSDGSLERSWALAPASNLNPLNASLSFSSDGRMLATSLGYPGPAAPSGALAVIDTSGPAVIQTPAVDPANWADNSTTRFLEFVAGDSMLLVDSSFEVGDSPPTEILSLYRPPCGPAITLFEAWDGTTAYAVSPDGQFVAFASRPPDTAPGLSVVEASTGDVVASDPSFLGTVLAFAPDSAAFYVQQDDVITALDARTLEHIRSLSLPGGAAFKTIAPNGNLVVTTATSTAWLDPVTGAVTRTVPFAIGDVVWSRDGALEVDTGGGTLFDAFQTDSGTELCKMAAQSGAITTFVTSPLGTSVAYGHDDGTIEVDSADASAPVQRFSSNVVPVRSLSVSDDGRRVAVPGPTSGRSPSEQLPVTIFDVDTGSAVTQLSFPALWSSAGVFSRDGRTFALGFLDPSTNGWRTRAIDLASGQVLLEVSSSGTPLGADTPDHFSSDGTELAVATEHGVDVWRLSDATQVKSFGAGSRALSPWWTYVASATATDEALSVTWASTGKPAGTFPAGDFPSVMFDGNEQIVAAPAFVDHTHAIDYFAQHVWDMTTGGALRIFGPMGGFALPSAGEQILTGAGGDVAVWCR